MRCWCPSVGPSPRGRSWAVPPQGWTAPSVPSCEWPLVTHRHTHTHTHTHEHTHTHTHTHVSNVVRITLNHTAGLSLQPRAGVFDMPASRVKPMGVSLCN